MSQWEGQWFVSARWTWVFYTDPCFCQPQFPNRPLQFSRGGTSPLLGKPKTALERMPMAVFFLSGVLSSLKSWCITLLCDAAKKALLLASKRQRNSREIRSWCYMQRIQALFPSMPQSMEPKKYLVYLDFFDLWFIRRCGACGRGSQRPSLTMAMSTNMTSLSLWESCMISWPTRGLGWAGVPKTWWATATWVSVDAGEGGDCSFVLQVLLCNFLVVLKVVFRLVRGID